VIVTLERSKLAPPTGGSVVSIGVFDGVHLGHRAILAANLHRSAGLGAMSTVVTFRRHPKRLLLGHAPRTLTTLEHRLELFARVGIAHAVVLNFDEDLRGLSARDFVREVCVDGLGVKGFVLGFDSKFGREREGTPELLRALGFEVEVVDQVLLRGKPISSTVIREAVELGDLALAQAMLGRPVSVFGLVVHGDGRGRSIGFPTANLDLHHELHPPPGVYACRAHRVRSGGKIEEVHPAVTNIGFRPTVSAEPAALPLVEVHLLDFAGDLYGERLELEFVGRLREEKRFASLQGLRAQIARDVAAARELLNRAGDDRGSASHGR
jgi:riboflavin kinase/FMN adenylyltransferase